MPPGRLRVMAVSLASLINRADSSRLANTVVFQGAATRYLNCAAFLNLHLHHQHQHGQRSHDQRTTRRGVGSSCSASATKLDGIFQRRRQQADASSVIARDGGLVAIRRGFSGRVGTAIDSMAGGGGLESGGGEATTRATLDVEDGLSMEYAREALRSLFGHDDFRDGQVRRSWRRASAFSQHGTLEVLIRVLVSCFCLLVLSAVGY